MNVAVSEYRWSGEFRPLISNKRAWAIRDSAIAAVLLLSTLALGIYGIARSLSLDESWVANSVLEPSVAGMFYYPDWLQTTPPLFLLLTRAAVQALGVSNVAFRVVPLAFALCAVAAAFAAARRLLTLPFAAAASVAIAFHHTAIEYSHTCKQYSAELAATAAILLVTVLYLENPDRRRFLWLVSLILLALPLAWATVFLLPGVAIVVWGNGGFRRASALVLAFTAELTILYVAFIHANLAPELRAFWTATAQKPTAGVIAALIFCAAAAVHFLLTIRKRGGPRRWIQAAALLPLFLLAAARFLHLYPADPRTRLFVLPCFVLVAAIVAEDLYGWLIRRTPSRRLVANFANAALWLFAIVVAYRSLRTQIDRYGGRPEEDFESAVHILRQEVSPADLLLVHASANQGFKLYARMERWNDYHALYGDTGWPCCARNKAAPERSAASIRVVAEDIDHMVPRDFSGRVWMFYSVRRTHWDYIGYEEPALWSNRLHARGCTSGPYYLLYNVAISAMNCKGAQ